MTLSKAFNVPLLARTVKIMISGRHGVNADATTVLATDSIDASYYPHNEPAWPKTDYSLIEEDVDDLVDELTEC